MSDAALQRLALIVWHARSAAAAPADDGLCHLANSRSDELRWGWEVVRSLIGPAVLATSPARDVLAGWARRSGAGASSRACDRLRSVNLMGTPSGDGVIRALAGKPELRQFKSGRAVMMQACAASRVPVFKTGAAEKSDIDLMSVDAAPNQLAVDGPLLTRPRDSRRLGPSRHDLLAHRSDHAPFSRR